MVAIIGTFVVRVRDEAVNGISNALALVKLLADLLEYAQQHCPLLNAGLLIAPPLIGPAKTEEFKRSRLKCSLMLFDGSGTYVQARHRI